MRILSLLVISFGLPFYFGYGNPLPFIDSSYTLWDNTWLSVFPIMFIGLALGWKYERLGGYLSAGAVFVGLIIGIIAEGEIPVHMLVPLAIGVVFIFLGARKRAIA
ncbi:MAG: hypothetical protein H6760_02130 [Candidatus Nomurabacteria bacterium]|nr:MAG: hypothetical protein H6760_02130 [Candidatus Nomurabacteria bacterium]